VIDHLCGVQVESLLLVGDPQQLPPTVRSHSAEKLGLGTSLFLRLQSMGLKPMLLDTQYRWGGAQAVQPVVQGCKAHSPACVAHGTARAEARSAGSAEASSAGSAGAGSAGTAGA